jgi:hypothetical protein
MTPRNHSPALRQVDGRRWYLCDSMLDDRIDTPSLRQWNCGFAGTRERARINRERAERRENRRGMNRLRTTQFVETWIRVAVEARGCTSVTHEEEGGHVVSVRS